MTFTFETSGDAYDACQCRDEIRNGDLLDIVGEGVVGLAWTWPVAVTAEAGALHTINPGAVFRVRDDAGWTDAQIKAAIAHAKTLGLAIHAAFTPYAENN